MSGFGAALLAADVAYRAGDAVGSCAARQGDACPVCSGELTDRRTIRCPARGHSRRALTQRVCLACETTVARRFGPVERAPS